MLVLMRVIMTAAFDTDGTKNIGEAITLARKSSSVPDEESLDAKTLEKKKSNLSAVADTTLSKLMAEGFAADILLETDFS